jgi:hypothetical protein
MANPQFQVVEETDALPRHHEPSSQAVDAFLLQLRILSQKTIIAAASLFQLLTVASVFWLALQIVPRQPSPEQLGGLAGYAIFVLIANWLVTINK